MRIRRILLTPVRVLLVTSRANTEQFRAGGATLIPVPLLIEGGDGAPARVPALGGDIPGDRV